MRTVSVAQTFAGSVHQAETRWNDLNGWANWVDGLSRVISVEGDWPLAGASVVWESGPAGRGRVTERVVHYEPLMGQTVEVEDDSIRGRQSVSFTPVDGSVEVLLSLEYEIKQRTILTPLVDVVFIRRPMLTSLAATLRRFGAELTV